MSTSLYKSALGGAKLLRHGDLIQVQMGAGGGFLTTATAFQCVARWAESQPSRGSRQMDRNQFFSRIELIVPELSGLNLPTKGSQQAITKLQKAATSLGLDPKLFDFPKEIPKQAASKSAPAPDLSPTSPPPRVTAGDSGNPPLSPEQFAAARGLSYVSRHSEAYQDYLREHRGGDV